MAGIDQSDFGMLGQPQMSSTVGKPPAQVSTERNRKTQDQAWIDRAGGKHSEGNIPSFFDSQELALDAISTAKLHPTVPISEQQLLQQAHRTEAELVLDTQRKSRDAPSYSSLPSSKNNGRNTNENANAKLDRILDQQTITSHRSSSESTVNRKSHGSKKSSSTSGKSKRESKRSHSSHSIKGSHSESANGDGNLSRPNVAPDSKSNGTISESEIQEHIHSIESLRSDERL